MFIGGGKAQKRRFDCNFYAVSGWFECFKKADFVHLLSTC
jgi:hypothetical protein